MTIDGTDIFLLIMDQTEFHLVYNHKENWLYNIISVGLNGNGCNGFERVQGHFHPRNVRYVVRLFISFLFVFCFPFYCFLFAFLFPFCSFFFRRLSSFCSLFGVFLLPFCWPFYPLFVYLFIQYNCAWFSSETKKENYDCKYFAANLKIIMIPSLCFSVVQIL